MTKHHATTGRVLENIVIIHHLKKKEVVFIGNRLLQINLTTYNGGIQYERDR